MAPPVTAFSRKRETKVRRLDHGSDSIDSAELYRLYPHNPVPARRGAAQITKQDELSSSDEFEQDASQRS